MSKCQVMILGTFHFREGEPDMKNEKSQQELKELIKDVSRFKPTKLCVELRPSEEEKHNKMYHAYLKDTSTDLDKMLKEIGIRGADNNINDYIDERIKFSFDMAKFNNLDRIYGIDYFNGWNQPDAFYEAEKQGEDMSKKINDGYMVFINKFYESMDNPLKLYHMLNLRENNELQHSTAFIPFCELGEGEYSAGRQFLCDWYTRNIHIFANLKRVCKDGDRVLVLYGAGHRKVLEDFIRDDLEMEYVDSIDYIK